MKTYRRRFQLPWVTEKRFIGNWDFRLKTILECNLDFKGKRILDAGCNIGLIDYEISKFEPSFIHGIDNYKAGIYAARNIFAGVEVPSRFEILDMANDKRLRKSLDPSYDIVLFMSVWQHIRRELGSRIADRMTATLAERCNGIFVGQTAKEQASEFSELMKSLGFAVVYDRDPLGRLFTYARI